MARNYIFSEGAKFVAVGGKDYGKAFQITDSKSVKAIQDLLEQRRKLGLEISEVLKDAGVDTADDEDTVATVD